MYQCIIFDVDGTLIESEGTILKSIAKFAQVHMGLSLQEKDLTHFAGVCTSDFLTRIGFPAERNEEGVRLFNEIAATYVNEITMFDGIQELLDTLRERGYTMGVCTSRNRAEYEEDIRHFGFQEYFQYTVVVDDVQHPKPNPEPVLKFLNLSGMQAKDCLYLGDSINDYGACKAAGVDFALARWGCMNDSGMADPEYELAHPLDVLRVLDEQKRQA